MQAWTDGTHRKCIREWENAEEVEVLCADMDWLYYYVADYDSDEITYRAPIEKDKEGYDVVRFSKEEEIVKKGQIVPIYADADYYFYIDLGTCKLIKYDLKRKKTISEDEKPGAEANKIFRLNDYYFCLENPGYCYVQEKDAGKWEKICGCMAVEVEDYVLLSVSNGGEFFHPRYVIEDGEKEASSFEIMGSDGEKERRFVSWEQVSQKVKGATGAEKLDICMPAGMFWQEGRLYFQIQAGWMKEGLYHMEYMVFSQGEDGSGLQYEKKLTLCMRAHVKERIGKWTDGCGKDETVYVERMVVNGAKCIAMVDGTAYLSLYDYGKDKGRLGCYDLDTGKFGWVDKQDAAFYKLGYDCGDPDYFFGEVFDDHYHNRYAHEWYWLPLKIKDYSFFLED